MATTADDAGDKDAVAAEAAATGDAGPAASQDGTEPLHDASALAAAAQALLGNPQLGNPPQPASRFWRLGEHDRRTLYITFVGGLAANVGLVLMVGLGLLVAHQVEHTHDALVVLGIATLVTVVLMILRLTAPRAFIAITRLAVLVVGLIVGPVSGAVAISVAISIGAAVERVLAVLTVLASLAVAVLILALVGLSAGIK